MSDKLVDTLYLSTMLDFEDMDGRPLWSTRIHGAAIVPPVGAEMALPNHNRMFVVVSHYYVYKYPPAEGWVGCHVVVMVKRKEVAA